MAFEYVTLRLGQKVGLAGKQLLMISHLEGKALLFLVVRHLAVLTLFLFLHHGLHLLRLLVKLTGADVVGKLAVVLAFRLAYFLISLLFIGGETSSYVVALFS